jgi:hypothetical protein
VFGLCIGLLQSVAHDAHAFTGGLLTVLLLLLLAALLLLFFLRARQQTRLL